MKAETINPDYALEKNPLSVIPEMFYRGSGFEIFTKQG
jgi:hypothetical protein